MDDSVLEVHLDMFLKELTESTKAGTVEWRLVPVPDQLRELDDRVGLVFATEYKNKPLRIFHASFKIYYDDTNFSWDEKVELQIVDSRGNALWDFPKTPEIWQLLEAIKFKAAGVEELFANIS